MSKQKSQQVVTYKYDSKITKNDLNDCNLDTIINYVELYLKSKALKKHLFDSNKLIQDKIYDKIENKVSQSTNKRLSIWKKATTNEKIVINKFVCQIDSLGNNKSIRSVNMVFDFAEE
jgi:hypothetical protein